jgi:hypothetical protein
VQSNADANHTASLSGYLFRFIQQARPDAPPAESREHVQILDFWNA